MAGVGAVGDERERIVIRPTPPAPEATAAPAPPIVVQHLHPTDDAPGVLASLRRFTRRLRGDDQRLQSALTCPYCRDDFADPQATVCARDGCDAFYHSDCWEECLKSYGGCGVFGCGSTHGHEVGPDALKRRMRRMLIAAALFPPRAIRRLSEAHADDLQEVYEQAREQRDAIARSPQRSFRVGIFAMAASFVVAMLVIANSDPNWLRSDEFMWVIPLFFFVPAPFFAAPFFAYLFWGLLRLLSRGFQRELHALERAEKGKAAPLRKGKAAGKPHGRESSP